MLKFITVKRRHAPLLHASVRVGLRPPLTSASRYTKKRSTNISNIALKHKNYNKKEAEKRQWNVYIEKNAPTEGVYWKRDIFFVTHGRTKTPQANNW